MDYITNEHLIIKCLNEKGVNVLIVNQFKETSDLLATILKEMSDLNYLIHITHNLEDGLKATESGNHYDLVISGIGNKWGDGYSFIRHVKERGYKSVVISGYGKGIEQEVFCNGADAFIPMPFDINEAVKTIDSVVEKFYPAKINQRPVYSDVNENIKIR